MRSGEKFYRGIIREPDGNGERVVVGKAAKALAQAEGKAQALTVYTTVELQFTKGD